VELLVVVIFFCMGKKTTVLLKNDRIADVH
jgi:hypothetical protein